jgi:Icc-related predicted phosphoesterase
MRILLTADMHNNQRWFRWLEKHAQKYDLICIAGDLLDLFSRIEPKPQVVQATAFLQAKPESPFAPATTT